MKAKVYPEAGTCLLGDLPVIIGTSKFECRIRRQNDHCSRAVVTATSRGFHENSETRRRQSSLPPSYSQSWSTPERRTSLETCKLILVAFLRFNIRYNKKFCLFVNIFSTSTIRGGVGHGFPNTGQRDKTFDGVRVKN